MSGPKEGSPRTRALWRLPQRAPMTGMAPAGPWATAMALTRQQLEPALVAALKASWEAPSPLGPHLQAPWGRAHWKAQTLELATAPVRQQQLAPLLFQSSMLAASQQLPAPESRRHA